MKPFIVFALPRSMTAWTAKFLSYHDWHCGHEEIRHIRSLADVESWFSQSFTGTVETAAAPFWRLLPPNVTVATIRRPVGEVVESLMRLGQPFDRAALETGMRRLDAKLDQIEARLAGCISVKFGDPDGHRALFEHCLGIPFDPDWYAGRIKNNEQCSVPALLRYEIAHRAQLIRANIEAREIMFHWVRSRKWPSH